MAAAAATTQDTVTIQINGIDLDVPKGELIVEAVKRLGLEIPIFCYHPRMKPVGMCRMCFVEVGFKGQDGQVKKMPKPQAACTLPASEGMAIFTDTEAVHKDRKGVLEFLLINHPLDCPICDRGGECPLQNNTLFYGPSTTRFLEHKRHLPKAFPLSDYVTLDLERCIQCGRCVRFTEEISGDAELAFRFRGAQMQPSTFELRQFTSKFSGNVIEVCPVGALTSSKYRFRARPWDLETKPGICTVCSNGCSIWIDHRVGKIVRVNGRTNEAVNEEWTCDRGKFGHDFYNSPKRLTTPMIRKDDSLVPCTWPEAYAAIIGAFGSNSAAFASPTLSNEALFLLHRLFRQDFGSNNIDHRVTQALPAANQKLKQMFGYDNVRTRLADFETKPRIFIFGTSLADELPILFLRVRKAWFQNGAKVVVASDKPTDADSFADVILRYKPGTEAVVAGGLLKALVDQGKAQVPAPTKKALEQFTADVVEKQSGVARANMLAAAEVLAEGAATITTWSLLNASDGQDVIETLAGIALTTEGEFNCYGLEANDEGAEIISRGQSEGLNTDQILKGAVNGSIDALWLAGTTPLSDWPDRANAEKALESVPFLVVQAMEETEEMGFASVVLPMACPAESDGTYTSFDRRVQRLQPILTPPTEAKQPWRVFAELSLRIKPQTPFFNPGEVLKALAKENPAFADLSYDTLPAEGALLPLQ